MQLEIFSPPYLFKGAKPVIGDVPAEWNYGQTVTITSAAAGNIRWVSIIRSCVTTHSFDCGQRLVARVPGDSRFEPNQTVSVSLPPDRTLAFDVSGQRL